MKVHFASFGMQVEQPLTQLSHFRHSTGNCNPRDRVTAKILEHSANEITHVDQSHLRQAVQSCYCSLRSRTRRPRHMMKTCGTRDIDATPDRVYPRGTRVGNHSSRGSQDRQSTDYPETTVQSPFRDLRPTRNRQFDDGIGSSVVLCGDLRNRGSNHLAWDGINRGLAWQQRQASASYRADTLSRTKKQAGPPRSESDGGHDQCAVGYVGIISGILDDAGPGKMGASLAARQGKRWARTIRHQDGDRVRECACQQSLVRSTARGGGACSSCPTMSQRATSCRILHGALSYRAAAILPGDHPS
jgi:hypothetical protein